MGERKVTDKNFMFQTGVRSNVPLLSTTIQPSDPIAMNYNDTIMILWLGKCFTCSAVLSTFVLLTYLVVSHVGLGSVQ